MTRIRADKYERDEVAHPRVIRNANDSNLRTAQRFARLEFVTHVFTIISDMLLPKATKPQSAGNKVDFSVQIRRS
jgi:hypothetical protein